MSGLRPETEALVQQSAAELVTPDIATMRRVAASIEAAFDRAAAVRAARQIAETNMRTDEVERRRKGLAA